MKAKRPYKKTFDFEERRRRRESSLHQLRKEKRQFFVGQRRHHATGDTNAGSDANEAAITTAVVAVVDACDSKNEAKLLEALQIFSKHCSGQWSGQTVSIAIQHGVATKLMEVLAIKNLETGKKK